MKTLTRDQFDGESGVSNCKALRVRMSESHAGPAPVLHFSPLSILAGASYEIRFWLGLGRTREKRGTGRLKWLLVACVVLSLTGHIVVGRERGAATPVTVGSVDLPGNLETATRQMEPPWVGREGGEPTVVVLQNVSVRTGTEPSVSIEAVLEPASGAVPKPL